MPDANQDHTSDRFSAWASRRIPASQATGALAVGSVNRHTVRRLRRADRSTRIFPVHIFHSSRCDFFAAMPYSSLARRMFRDDRSQLSFPIAKITIDEDSSKPEVDDDFGLCLEWTL
jgi:hypothetical protein